MTSRFWEEGDNQDLPLQPIGGFPAKCLVQKLTKMTEKKKQLK